MDPRELVLAKKTLLHAMDVASGVQLAFATGRGLAIEEKGENDIVTEVDRRCQERVTRILREFHPDHGVLAEEDLGERKAIGKRGPLWVLDPLDGTKNYAHQQQRYACSLALLWDGDPILGAVRAPALGETFLAQKGAGATVNGKPLRVSATTELSQAAVATALTVYNRVERHQLDRVERLVRRVQAVRVHGCASLDLCDVARGRLDAFVEEGLRPWDTAAGALVVREAGGVVTTFTGLSYDPFGSETLAATPGVSQGLVALLKGS